jgi:nicotinate-nucleotide adenylyltransferase
VRVIPSAQPPHREAPQVSPERRMEWVQLALQHEPALIADDRELRRAGPSYTHDTLAELREEFPDRPLVLLLGDDAANQFHTWHRWREIIELAHLVFVERPYEPPAPAPELIAHLRGRRAQSNADFSQQLAGLWLSANIPPLAISSTRVRRLLKAGRSVRGLVPESVIASFTHKDISLLTYDEEPATD